MSKQPYAFWLVNHRANAHMLSWQANACSELIRLTEVNQELVDALEGLLTMPDYDGTPETSKVRLRVKNRAKRAVSKARSG